MREKNRPVAMATIRPADRHWPHFCPSVSALAPLVSAFSVVLFIAWCSCLALMLLSPTRAEGSSWHGLAQEGDRASRQIVDPCLGLHWLLMRNDAHPGWPGRLVLVEDRNTQGLRNSSSSRQLLPEDPFPSNVSLTTQPVTTQSVTAQSVTSQPNTASPSASLGRQPALAGQSPADSSIVIRAGDRVFVDQDSERIQARFEALALGPASIGQLLRVRLHPGKASAAGDFSGTSASVTDGPIISVWVLAPGRARWVTGPNTATADWTEK